MSFHASLHSEVSFYTILVQQSILCQYFARTLRLANHMAQYSYEKLDWRGTDLGPYVPIMYSFEVDSYHGLQ